MVSYFRRKDAAYRAGWSDDFSREPLDVYAQKERERTADLLRNWGAANAGKGPLGEVLDNFFTSAADYVAQEAQKAQATQPQPSNYNLNFNYTIPTQPSPKKKGGGLLDSVFGAVKDFGENALHAASKGAEVAGQAFEAPLKYGVAPAADILSGGAGGYRKTLTSNPVSTFHRAVGESQSALRNLEEHGVAGFNPKIAGQPVIATAIETAANPLSYVGAGAGGVGATAAKAAKLAAGSIGGGIAGSVVAKRLGVPEQYQPLAQLAGSLAGGHVAAHPETVTRIPERVAGAAAKAGVVPEGAVPGAGMIRTVKPGAEMFHGAQRPLVGEKLYTTKAGEFGPGAYLTSSPESASNYAWNTWSAAAEDGRARLGQGFEDHSGANVSRWTPTQNLKLLRADKQLSMGDSDAIKKALAAATGQTPRGPWDWGGTGQEALDALRRLSPEGFGDMDVGAFSVGEDTFAGSILRQAGFDGMYSKVSNTLYEDPGEHGRIFKEPKNVDEITVFDPSKLKNVTSTGEAGGVEAPRVGGDEPGTAGAPPPTEAIPVQRSPEHVEPESTPNARSDAGVARGAPETAAEQVTEPPIETSSPPLEPPKPPEPPIEASGPGEGPQPERPASTVDLLRGKPRDQLLANELANPSTPDKVRIAMGRNPSDERTKIVRTEKDRTDHIVTELAPQQAERIRADAEDVGLNVVPGDNNDWVLEGTDVPIEDVVEGTTDAGRAAYQNLDADQRAVIDEIQRINQDWNSTIEAHGGTVPMRDTPNGNFWPRRVMGRTIEGEFVEKNRGGTGPGGRRALGASRIGHRTQESVQAGQEAGIQYANPWDALAGGLKNKARVAQDSYLANLIKPLAVDERPGFGIRTLPGHPALTKKQFVGQTDSGAVLLADKPMAFESEVAKDLDAIFNGKDAVNIRAVKWLNALLTPLRATADMSWSLQQGLAPLEKNPIRTIRDSARAVRSALGDEQAYHDVIRGQEARGKALLESAGIDTRSALDWHMQRGLHYSAEAVSDEFKFPSAIEKVPVVGKLAKFSNETFGRTLNADRLALANDALERAIKKGLRGGALDDAMEGAEQSVNRMTGWTSSKPSSIESHALFAPRFFRSNLEQIAAAFTKGDLEGKLAREHLARLTAIAVGTTVAVNSLRGYKTDFDPRSSNFMRMRNVAGQDISPFGTFATLIRGAAQFTQDPKDATKYFLRAKSSPVVSTVWSLVTGSNFEGEEFNPLSPSGAVDAAIQIGKETLPFSAQSAIEGAEEGGIAGAAGSGVTSFLGAQSSPLTPAERRDMIRDQVSKELNDGVAYNDLKDASLKAKVNQDPRVQAAIQKAQKNALTKNNDYAKSTQFNLDFQSTMEAAADALQKGQEPNGQPYTGVDYRHTYQDATAARLNQLKGAGINYSGGDPVVEGWYALYDQATMPDKNIDYDKLDALQVAYEQAHPDVQARIAKVVGANDDPTLQRLRNAQKEAQQYYDIPPYAGLTLDQGNRAQRILSMAQGYAGGTLAALSQLVSQGTITADDANLALIAQRLGTNPQRRQFTASRPDFAVFYQGYANGDEAQQAALLAAAGSRGSSNSGVSRFRGGGSRSGGSSGIRRGNVLRTTGRSKSRFR